MSKILEMLLKEESGATAIEYGLIASLLVVGIMGSLNFVAGETISMWNGVSGTIAGSMAK